MSGFIFHFHCSLEIKWMLNEQQKYSLEFLDALQLNFDSEYLQCNNRCLSFVIQIIPHTILQSDSFSQVANCAQFIAISTSAFFSS